MEQSAENQQREREAIEAAARRYVEPLLAARICHA